MGITVFTPTYNRGYILTRTYNSLKKQTNKNFIWVIMDDGSTDNTEELVRSWKQDNVIKISYHKQENQGRFAAYNNARKFFEGELVAFLDSDDVYLPNCIQKILDTWNNNADNMSYGGILALMESQNNDVIGTEFPDILYSERIYVLYDKYHMQGDKLIVLRRDLAQKYSYPVFTGEKFGGDSIVFNKVSDEKPMILLNEILVCREYLPDSITNNLLLYHLKSKNGMREHYLDCLVHEKYDKHKILKHYIGYVSYSLLTRCSFKTIIERMPNKIAGILLYPLGVLYYIRLNSMDKKLSEVKK